MFYHFLYPLHVVWGPLNVFRYLTFRMVMATLTALLISLIIGPWMINKLSQLKANQPIRKDGPQSHLAKEGTPTMGGLLILFAITISTLLWTDLRNQYVWLVLLVTLGFGITGFVDDYKKLTGRNSKGIGGKLKLLVQVGLALAAGTILYLHLDFDTTLSFPFIKQFSPALGLLYLPFVTLVIVGASNAVNLTDGLDGLAIGPVIIASGTYLLFAYLVGHVKIAAYLQIPYVAGAGELSIFGGAIVGSSLGFLWFNAYPAQVFMGDVGSLSLGAALGLVAVVSKHEILLVLVGGVFVVEALSVIFQVASFKIRGQRIFKMAPIHHHYELKGWAEPKIIVRFWIISLVLALLAFSTLKLR
ncbi:MAG: phospho-N-acetylmuramoyl-pentapeptide-transferase [Thermodesulfobacteriota bacterium]